MLDQKNQKKRQVGIEAARLVKDHNVVGLGTGSTTAFAIEELGRRIREEKLFITGIPTSYQAAILARQHKIPLCTLDDVASIDIAIDGADEVDPQKNLIKGGGGAHTTEKVVDSLADLFVVVVDEEKLVNRLGEKFPVPVEVLPMAISPVMRQLQKIGGEPTLRPGINKAGPVITDQGNLILDVRFPSIDDPAALEAEINSIPGVVDNGIFVSLADVVLVANDQGVRRF